MEMKRHGEKQGQLYRSSRFYAIANEWFFSVREGEDLGPYMSKINAEDSLKTYISDREHFCIKTMKQAFLGLV